jgi:hypothetical protein
MEIEKTVLNTEIHSFAEMVAQILRDEGIEAEVISGNVLGSALQAEAGVGVGGDWRVVVSTEDEANALKILDELEKAGEEEFDNEKDGQETQ